MSDKMIYDAVGRLIGRLSTQSNGDIQVYAADGRYLGYASQAAQKTFDAGGRLVSQSFIPAILLGK